MGGSTYTAEYSSGGVVYRRTARGHEIAIVQRARHDDWSLPKGHIEEGESREEAALREVEEETGLQARIVAPLEEVVYFFKKRDKLIKKTVYHYLMEATSEELGGPNWEVSEARWVSISEADALLTYEKDRAVVAKAMRLVTSDE